MIYFAQDIRKRLIKIGYSQDVEKRLKHLSLEATRHQTHKHRRGERLYHYLRCLWTEPGGVAREKELHQQFANAKKKGEWFAQSDELCEYLVHRNPKLTMLSNTGRLWKAS